MIDRWIQFFLAQRLLVLMLVFGILGAGYRALMETPVDAFPDVSPTQVKLIFKAPGMTPAEVESRVIAPLEMELLGIPGETMMRSMGKYGIADITIDFAEGTDIYWARQQVNERLAQVTLPEGVVGGLAPISTPLGDVFMFTIEGDALSLMEKRDLLDWVIRPALRSVPGVADVNALGGFVRVFAVRPDLARMAAHDIDFEQLRAALEDNNRNDGAGRLTEGEEVLLVRTTGNYSGTDDIGRTVVAVRDGVPIRVADVARVEVASLARYGAVTRDGKGEAVQGLVIALKGANAREVIRGVRERLDALERTLPEGMHLQVFYDRSELVNRATWTVNRALIEAVVLVLLLLLAFLGNLRAAITVALILPLAILLTCILMRLYGMTANLMSLGGLVIALGMLVDAAVVVVENIVTHLQRGDSRLPRLHLVYRATQEVALPVISGIGIIIIVFLPLLSLEGLEGKLFRPVALTIVFALASAVLLSLTVIPALASMLLGRVRHEESRLVRWLQARYVPLLDHALARPRLAVGGALLAMAGAVGIYALVGKSFMPQMDEGNVILQVEKSPAISLEASVALDLRIQRALLDQVPEIVSMVGRVGSDELGMDPMGLNDTDMFMVLKPREAWRMADKAGLVAAMRAVLERDFPGINYAFTQPIQMRVDEMLTGARGDLAVKIFGDDPAELNRLAKELVALIEQVPGATDVRTPVNEGSRYLRITPDRDAIGRMGLSVERIADLLRAQLEGLRVGTVYRDIRRIPLLIRGAPELGADSPRFLNLEVPLPLPEGGSVTLRQLVRVERVSGPVLVKREMGKRFAVVVANVRDRDLVGFVEEVQQRARALDLPLGYHFSWGGTFENQQRAAKRLSIVVPVALLMIFVILFASFRSVPQALLILLNVPLAMIGGIVALWLSGEYLSVPASVGFIALLGIAVLNGVVMVTLFNQLLARGMPLHRVVVEGARRRLRPVLMTASIAALGLVPLALATGPGSEIQRPLAIVVIGGLFTSTPLTLLLLPIGFRFVAGLEERRRNGADGAESPEMSS